MNVVVAKMLCGFPPRLHPVSQMFLDAYPPDTLTTAEFLRFFSLPNSDYIPLGQCLINLSAVSITEWTSGTFGTYAVRLKQI